MNLHEAHDPKKCRSLKEMCPTHNAYAWALEQDRQGNTEKVTLVIDGKEITAIKGKENET